MMHPWRVATLACVAVAFQMAGVHAAGVKASIKPADVSAAEAGDQGVNAEGMSDVDIAIGRTDAATTPSAFGLKLFTQPLPGTAASREIGDRDRIALRREFSFLGDADDASLSDVVAAVRNDPDQPAEPEAAGAAVDDWTGTLDDGELTLAPPPVRQAPRDAAGRSPSGMGSQIVP